MCIYEYVNIFMYNSIIENFPIYYSQILNVQWKDITWLYQELGLEGSKAGNKEAGEIQTGHTGNWVNEAHWQKRLKQTVG